MQESGIGWDNVSNSSQSNEPPARLSVIQRTSAKQSVNSITQSCNLAQFQFSKLDL